MRESEGGSLRWCGTEIVAIRESDVVLIMPHVTFQTTTHYVSEVWSSLESLCSFPSFCWQVSQQLHPV